MRALPHAYRDTSAPNGTLIQFLVDDLRAGNWFLYRHNNQWELVANTNQRQPDTRVRIDRAFAWQLFARNLPTEIASSYICIEGTKNLGLQLLTMRSVML